MLFEFPASFALIGLLASSAIASPAANGRRDGGGDSTSIIKTATSTQTASECITTGTGNGAAYEDILDILREVFEAITFAPAGENPRPVVVVPPFSNALQGFGPVIPLSDAAIQAIKDTTPTSTATAGAATATTNESDDVNYCNYAISPGQCVPVSREFVDTVAEYTWEAVKLIFSGWFGSLFVGNVTTGIPTLDNSTIGEIISSVTANVPGPTASCLIL